MKADFGVIGISRFRPRVSEIDWFKLTDLFREMKTVLGISIPLRHSIGLVFSEDTFFSWRLNGRSMNLLP